MIRFSFIVTCCLGVTLAIGGQVVAQESTSRLDPSDPLARPTELGFRLTPAMARLMAHEFVKDALVNGHELPEEKASEATEMVARRIMQLAHRIDQPGGEFIERFIEEQLAQAVDGQHSFMPKGFGKEFADRLLPMMPEIRGMITGVISDITPMLPFKQRVKLAGEVAAFNTAFNAFEDTMEKWSSGEITDYKDPFRQSRSSQSEEGPEEIPRDENGVPQNTKHARDSAKHELERSWADEWTRYVEQAKVFYDFDDAQSATAASILREMLQKAEIELTDSNLNQNLYRIRLWQRMGWQLETEWRWMFHQVLEKRYHDLEAPMAKMRSDLKYRIDSIPTEAQRLAATERVEAVLREKGLSLNTETSESRATAPSGGEPSQSTQPQAVEIEVIEDEASQGGDS